MAKNACSNPFAVYWTCREIWWSFFIIFLFFLCLQMPPLQDESCTCIVMWMRWVLKYFFFQRNILIWNFLFFFKKNISFPLSSKLHFAFLLVLHFESSSNLSFLYTFFFYINGTIVEKPDLNFLRELFWSLIGLWPKLRNLTWILLENSFNFLGDFQANFKKLGLNSPWEAFTSSNL